MVLALALLLAAQLMRERRPRPTVMQAALLLCVGLIVQVPGSAPWVEHNLGCAWHTPLVGIAVGNAVLFCLFTAALFDDGFHWRAWHALAWGLAALVGGVQCVAVVGLEPGVFLTALRVALRAVTILSLLAALWTALRHWRTDLVESRRRLRFLLVGAGVAYTLVQLAARLSTPTGLLTPGLALMDMAVLLAVMWGWALSTLRLHPGGLMAAGSNSAVKATGVDPGIHANSGTTDGSARSAVTTTPRPFDDTPASPVHTPRNAAAASQPSPAAAATADEALAATLGRTMVEDRAYRDDALTVSTLAVRLGVPEYRLRRHINQRLGYRNFNVYVNSFRLADARRWLADPAHGDAPVLTIALDAGFGSIGPFNRAFKADTGLTPTDYRRQALAESCKL